MVRTRLALAGSYNNDLIPPQPPSSCSVTVLTMSSEEALKAEIARLSGVLIVCHLIGCILTVGGGQAQSTNTRPLAEVLPPAHLISLLETRHMSTQTTNYHQAALIVQTMQVNSQRMLTVTVDRQAVPVRVKSSLTASHSNPPTANSLEKNVRLQPFQAFHQALKWFKSCVDTWDHFSLSH